MKVLTKPSKCKMKKEHTKKWVAIEKVERIERGGITFYALEGGARRLMRHELLKIEARGISEAPPGPQPPAPAAAKRDTSEAPRRRLAGKHRNPFPR